MPKLNWYKTASKLTLAADTGLEQCSANEAPQAQLPPCRVLLGPQSAAKQVLECTLRNLVVVHYTMILRRTTYIVLRIKCSRSLPSIVVFGIVCHYTVYALLLPLPLQKYICIYWQYVNIIYVYVCDLYIYSTYIGKEFAPTYVAIVQPFQPAI